MNDRDFLIAVRNTYGQVMRKIHFHKMLIFYGLANDYAEATKLVKRFISKKYVHMDLVYVYIDISGRSNLKLKKKRSFKGNVTRQVKSLDWNRRSNQMSRNR